MDAEYSIRAGRESDLTVLEEIERQANTLRNGFFVGRTLEMPVSVMLKRLSPYLFSSGAVIAVAAVLILSIPDTNKPSSTRAPQPVQIVFAESEINSIVVGGLAGQQNVSNVTVNLRPGSYGDVAFRAVVFGQSLPGTARAGIRYDQQQVYVALSNVNVSGQAVAAPDSSAATQELNRLIRARVNSGYTIQSVATTETELIVTVLRS